MTDMQRLERLMMLQNRLLIELLRTKAAELCGTSRDRSIQCKRCFKVAMMAEDELSEEIGYH